MNALSNLFLSPLGLLFGLSLPALVLLYLLKLKRKKEEVPSVLLWRQSLEDFTANSPFQRLRNQPLMFLQLLVLALLTLAMMRPTLNLNPLRGIDYYVLLDQSASMAASDVSPTRFESAKREIEKLVRGMGSGDRLTIVTFADHATVAVPLTDNQGEILTILKTIEIRETGTDLSEAMTILNASIGDDTGRSKLYVFSDGIVPESDRLTPPAVETVYRRMGEKGSNAGITRFSVTRPVTTDGEIQVYVEVLRTPGIEGEETLSLELNGETIDAHLFRWGEESKVSHVFRIPPVAEGVLSVSLDRNDDLPADNRAAVVLEPARPTQVRIYADGFTPVAKAVSQMTETRVHVHPTAAYSATEEADVFIFDSWTPPGLGNRFKGAMFLGTEPPEEIGLKWQGEVEFPIVLDWDRNHPVTRGAEYRNLQVAKSKRVDLADDFDVLLESRETPLLYAKEEGTRRFVGTTFTLDQSNWSRLYSFPITLVNAVRWLSGGDRNFAGIEVYRTGETIEIPSLPEQSRVRVIDPDGNEFSLDLVPNQKAFFSKTERTGEYRLVYSDGSERSLWINLLDPLESGIAVRQALAFGEEKLQASASIRPQNREVWNGLVILALAVLLLEWWFYTRQSWV